jgi:hypothetical protein
VLRRDPIRRGCKRNIGKRPFFAATLVATGYLDGNLGAWCISERINMPDVLVRLAAAADVVLTY